MRVGLARWLSQGGACPISGTFMSEGRNDSPNLASEVCKHNEVSSHTFPNKQRIILLKE